MCGPAAILGAKAVVGVGKAVGAAKRAGAQKRALRLQAQINDINADSLEAQAGRETAIGRTNASLRKTQGELQMAAETANAAGRGMDVNAEGTMDSITGTIDWSTATDVESIMQQARWEALGIRARAGNTRTEAAGQRAQAAAISPTMSFLGSAIGSAINIAGSAYNMKQAGGLGGGGFKAPKSFLRSVDNNMNLVNQNMNRMLSGGI